MAGRLVLQAALAQLQEWDVRVWYADWSFSCLGVYGISDSCPPKLPTIAWINEPPSQDDAQKAS